MIPTTDHDQGPPLAYSGPVGALVAGVPACAEFLGITERQARHRFATGQLPSFRIGETICSRKTTLAAALDRMEQQSLSTPDPAAA